MNELYWRDGSKPEKSYKGDKELYLKQTNNIPSRENEKSESCGRYG